jgi:hypothetical protein
LATVVVLLRARARERERERKREQKTKREGTSSLARSKRKKKRLTRKRGKNFINSSETPTGASASVTGLNFIPSLFSISAAAFEADTAIFNIQPQVGSLC